MSIPSFTINRPKNFDIEQIFNCGQCFRFNRAENSPKEFCGVAHSKYIRISQDENSVKFYYTTEEEFRDIWHTYFDLDNNYENIIKSFGNDVTLSKASSFASGIRILRQEKWEALCSFIISQNNNIPRIKGIIENMSAKYGEHIGFIDGKNRYAFPTPNALFEAGVDGLFALKTGFRAKYIYDAAKMVLDGSVNLDTLHSLPISDAVNELCKIKGVGPKVAQCTLLFGFARHDAFPIDVWVKRILEKYYSENIPECFSQENAGIAQQYLFYYERCINDVYL